MKKKKNEKIETEKVESEKEVEIPTQSKNYDSLPMSEGRDESIREGKFICTQHEVREVIKKDTGESAGYKLFLKGTVQETEEEVEISQAIVIGKEGSPKEAGLWVKEINGQLRIGTTVSMLRFYKFANIGAVDGKEFNVVKNEANYWIISGC